jgi:two-component system response regulator BaeR
MPRNDTGGQGTEPGMRTPRDGPHGQDVLGYDGVRVDQYRHRAFCGDQEVSLTPVQFRLLAVLLRRPGRTFSRSQLMDAVLTSRTNYPRTIDQHVKELRRKLGRPGLIETVHGVGYRLGARAGPTS